MRAFIVLVLALLFPVSVFAHPSERSYCANALGVAGGPYECFGSLGSAVEWIRSDDPPLDGWQFLAPAGQGACLTVLNQFVCDLPYAVDAYAPATQQGPSQFVAENSGWEPDTLANCGGGYRGGCATEGLLREHITNTYGTQGGEMVGGPYTTGAGFNFPGEDIDNTANPSESYEMEFRAVYGSNNRLWTNNTHDPWPWAFKRFQWFLCPPQYPGVVISAWPRPCQVTHAANIIATGVTQTDGMCRGNPCIVSTGNKIQADTDFSWNGKAFTRHYSAIHDFPAKSGMGPVWSHTYSGSLTFSSSGEVWYLDERNLIDLFREDSGAGTDRYVAFNATGMTLAKEGSGGSATWVVTKGSERRRFNLSGRLIAIESDQPERNVELHYCPSSPGPSDTCKTPNALHRVVNALGRELEFDYADDFVAVTVFDEDEELEFSPDLAVERQHKLLSVTADGTTLVEYDYDSKGRLAEVDYASGGTRLYHYGESTHTCLTAAGTATSTCPSHDFEHHLTGITDENGARYANFTYDELGRATSTSYDADPSGATTEVSRYSLDYQTDTTVVTHPSGMTESVVYGSDAAFVKPDEQITLAGTKAYTYDGDNRRTSVVDDRGVRTEYAYGDGDHVESVTEADGEPEQRTIQTDWNIGYDKPEERRVYDAVNTLVAKQTWTYNARRQLLTSTMIDPVTDDERTTTLAYCESGDVSAPGSTCPILGLLKSIDGPRTDVSDITTYTYYASTDESGCASSGACRKKGDLWKVTNALGHVTETLRYDRMGRPLVIRDPNGVDTVLTYDLRGWVETRAVGGATTSYAYDDMGQPTRITDPDGAYTDYEYDGAHRLVAIEDNAGNRMEYTLDAAGNRTVEDTRDAGDVLKRTLSRVYDDLNRVEELLDAQARATEFEYDENGNQTAVIDAAETRSESKFDPLNRLIESLQDFGGIAATTAYVYDANDQLREVVDPKGLSTEYTYDGLGNLTELDSPDTGVATYEYDIAGNRIQQTDARSVVTDYAYDELGRLLSIEYPTSALDVEFAYDQADGSTGCSGSEPLGRLTTMTDGSGSTTYCYDAHGMVTKKTQVTDSTTLEVEYRYTDGDRLDGITLPSGVDVEYGRDAQGRITSITVDGTPLVTDVDYMPFGPISRIAYAGGHVQVRTYDQNYWTTAVRGEAAGSWGLNFSHDDIGNIVALHEPTAAAVSDVDDESALPLGDPAETYTYDALSRLTGVYDHDSTLVEGYTYDDTGNRLTKSYMSADDGQGDDNGDSDVPRTPISLVPASEVIETYTYGGMSHRLTAVNGISRSYDENGNTTQLTNGTGTLTLTYSDNNRLTSVHSGMAQVGTYIYNGRGERVRKMAGGADVIFVYSENNELMGEYAGSAAIREYLWMDQLLVGVLINGALYAIESDHLGAARRMFDLNAWSTIWAWEVESNPFGSIAPGVRGTNDGGASIEFPIRYPGQYEDLELGVYYNYLRNYDPGAGRYIESDQIGLGGGLSTYGYALMNPLSYIDPRGMAPGDLFASVEDALNDLRRYAPTLEPRLVEHGGWIWEVYGKCVTYNVTTSNLPSRLRGEDLERIKPPRPLATWHTHGFYSSPTPSNSSANMLSGELGGRNSTGEYEGDTGVAEYWGVPNYLIAPSGEVRGYFPDNDSTSDVEDSEPCTCVQ